jgi:endonuclease YncB( thermonuclease family)
MMDRLIAGGNPMTLVQFRRRRPSRRRGAKFPFGPGRHWLAVGFAAFAVAAFQLEAPRQATDMTPTAAIAAPERTGRPRPFQLCGKGERHNCIVDGDTIWLDGENIRIADIDTPEVFSPSCPAEHTKGVEATRRMMALLNAGTFELRGVGRETDRYGRTLRTIHRDGESLGARLVAEGLAEEWGGRRIAWCS